MMTTRRFIGSVSNRNPKKQWFITYPKWNSTHSNIIAAFSNYDYYIVCKEKHKDGTTHFHLLIKFTLVVRKAELIEMVRTKYPNDWKRVHIQPVRNLKAAIEYCKKEDPDYVEFGSIDIKTKFQKWYHQTFKEVFGQTVEEHDKEIDDMILERIKIDYGDTESLEWMVKNFKKLKKYYL